MEFKYECEFGSSIPVRFPTNVKCYNEEGNEIEIPKCQKCGNYKTEAIGKHASAWFCDLGCEKIK